MGEDRGLGTQGKRGKGEERAASRELGRQGTREARETEGIT